MILVTGGAGFIGSNLVKALNAEGKDVAICDRLRARGKWKNLIDCRIIGLVHPDELWVELAAEPKLKAVVHLGAISRTDAVDGDAVVQANFVLSLRLLNWCAKHRTPFIYASSAATYGNPTEGFADNYAWTDRLKPLSLYAWSKHQFDLEVGRGFVKSESMPPQCVGLKFFNVYGPRELHKGDQASLIAQRYPIIRRGNSPKLFTAGNQKRDFVHVDDVVAVILWFLEHPDFSGLFNVGTGQARSFHDLMTVLKKACEQDDLPIDWVDMPPHLEKQYQSFTQADISQLRRVGYDKPFMPIEEGVPKYVEWLKVHT